MKMNRSQLKTLVKECLVEILNEGLDGSVQASTTQQRSISSNQGRQPAHLPERRTSAARTQNSEAVRMASAGNPILEAILADTNATTYHDQQMHDRPGSLGNHLKTGIERHVQQSTPEQLFGEDAASNWMSIMDRVGG